jgi:DsbC/DsbD-like thiol-disulfide interchange protein
MIRFKLKFSLCLSLAILWLVFPTLATSQILPGTENPLKIEVQTYPSPISAGQEVWVAVTLTLDRGWHIYGNPKGPGTGLPTTLEVTSLPKGIKADPARFLPAEKLIHPDLEPHDWVWVYRGKTTIYLPLSTPRDSPSGRHQINLRLRALLCRESSCMPRQRDLVARLTIVSDMHAMGTIPQWVRKEIQRTHVAKSK